MTRWSRVALSIIVSACLASAAGAVEVSLVLASATYIDCHWEGGLPHGDPFEVCDTPRAATLLPAAPQGHGSVIDLDAAGITIRAILQLDSFSLDGMPVGPATLTFAIDPGQPPTFDPGPLALPGQVADGTLWVNVTRMTDQSDFSGELYLNFSQGNRRWTFKFLYTAISTGPPPPCLGEVLYLDDDGDGEVNNGDASPSWADTLFGDAVDSVGRTPAEFCSIEGQAGRSNKRCGALDYRNDEPLLRRPADCVRMPDESCQPAEFFYRSQPPAVTSRNCLGYAVVDDADADGEPDATDLCASTPSGAAIDGDGCSAQQFCAAQPMLSCKRADFGNDEPLAKKPGDCARTQSKPRACTAATSK